MTDRNLASDKDTQVKSSTKKPWYMKLTAAGFILLILFANFWFIDFLFQQPVALWKFWGFYSGFFLCTLGGLGYLKALVTHFWKQQF